MLWDVKGEAVGEAIWGWRIKEKWRELKGGRCTLPLGQRRPCWLHGGPGLIPPSSLDCSFKLRGHQELEFLASVPHSKHAATGQADKC